MNNIARIFILLFFVAGKISAQCIVADTCPANPVPMCDLTANDQNLWNELSWLDLQTGLHDMPDAPADLSFTATDTCANGSITIKFVLLLDLDGNGTLETAVGSDSLPGFNVVNYGNAAAPGASRAFDERPVPANEKYGFAIENIVNGPTTTTRVRWNTSGQPGTFVNPELPYGLHKVRWIIADAQGQEQICEYNFEVKDCKAPTVVCLSNFSVNLMLNGQIKLWATDFLQYTEDNHTTSNLLQPGVRKTGTGTGFPLDSAGNPAISISYTCGDIGDQSIELWSRDIAGNVNFCQTIVTILDDLNACPTANFDAVICTGFWCNGAIIAGLDYGFGLPTSFDPANGCAFIENGFNYSPEPSKNGDYLNGVNTLDLIRISRHILGLQSLGSPYAMIAADANKSSSITTYDMVEYKKLIQGIYTELPNNTSWRFVDANFVFPNPANPFQWPGPDTISYYIQDSVKYYEFFGIKTGDVDCSAYPGFANPTVEDRITATLNLPDAMLLPGETVEISVRPAEATRWLGLQAGLRFDPDLLEIENVAPGNLPDMDASSFARPQPGMLNVVWFNTAPQNVLPDENLFTLRLKARAPVRLSEAVSLATEKFESEIYTAGEAAQKLRLQFTEPDGATVMFSPRPNPTAGSAGIPVRLVQTETVALELTDLSGKRLWFNQITLNSGAHLLEIPATALPLTGIYVWRVQAGTMTASGKLVKI